MWRRREYFCRAETELSDTNVSRHGVNQAEALKSEALTWRITGDDSDKQSTVVRIDMLYKYHGRASGTLQTISPILENADHDC